MRQYLVDSCEDQLPEAAFYCQIWQTRIEDLEKWWFSSILVDDAKMHANVSSYQTPIKCFSLVPVLYGFLKSLGRSERKPV